MMEHLVLQVHQVLREHRVHQEVVEQVDL
jgi:hypothetical protein